jgi:hypothetical protein
MKAHPRLTWFTSCWAVLARLKAAESQRPKDTPIQAEIIYYLSAGAVLQRPVGAAWAVVHGAAVQGRRHDRRRRRRRRPRSRQAADEDLDGDVVGPDSAATNLHLKSRAWTTLNLRMPSRLRVVVKDELWGCWRHREHKTWDIPLLLYLKQKQSMKCITTRN